MDIRRSTIAPSGGVFLEGDDWESWEGRLAVATLKAQSLRIFEFTSNGDLVSHVVVPELLETYGRLRSTVLGPDGALYITTSNEGRRDRILKVVPSLPPEFPSETVTQGVSENTSTVTIIATVVATDPDGETLTYKLSGPDAASFIIPNASAGELSSTVPPGL